MIIKVFLLIIEFPDILRLVGGRKVDPNGSVLIIKQQ